MKARSAKSLLLMVASALVAGCSLVGCNGVQAHPPTTDADMPAARQLPFAEAKPLVVPANTPVYVRLQESISSSTAHEGQNFSAVLDQPLVVDDKTIAPEGTPVTGTVVAVRESGRLHNLGYLRIALTSITLNGKPTPLQTNSVFVGGDRKRNIAVVGSGKGGTALLNALASGGKNSTANKPDAEPGKKRVGFGADYRLGFRLTQPLNIG
jgi:hypothetical protein